MSFFDFAGGLLGGLINANETRKANQNNANLQREFAQNSLSWKIEDAKRAGIHPLAAIGAPTYGAAPSFVGGDFGSSVAQSAGALGRAFAEKQDKGLELDIERKELENLKLRKEISQMGANPLSSLTGAENQLNAVASVGKDLAGPLNKTLRVMGDLALTPSLANRDSEGNLVREWVLTPDPDSQMGQESSEGLFAKYVNAFEVNKMLNAGGLDRLEKEMRHNGLIGKNEKIDYFMRLNGHHAIRVVEHRDKRLDKSYYSPVKGKNKPIGAIDIFGQYK